MYDFLDGLVALHLLEREGQGEAARYRNTAETALFLDRDSPGYTGADFRSWCTDVGFQSVEVLPLGRR